MNLFLKKFLQTQVALLVLASLSCSSFCFAADEDAKTTEPTNEVGACASTLEDLAEKKTTVVLYRDRDDRLQLARDSQPSPSPVSSVSRRGEAKFRIEARNFALEIVGRRLARFSGLPFLVFDARARAKEPGAKTVGLACRLSADGLRAPDESLRHR